MSGDFDPRDFDSRDRDDGIHDREDEWLVLGRGPGSSEVRDDAVDAVEHDTRDRDDERGGIDPRDAFMNDLDLPRDREREPVHDVSKFLGHRNLSTTTRYLNTTSRRLRLALMRVEQDSPRRASHWFLNT